MAKRLNDWFNHISQKSSPSQALGFASVKAIADCLNLTQFNCPVVKVAGTNGKGSSVAALEALALQSNVSIAIYTSPHFININERLRINCEVLSEDAWCSAFQYIEDHTLEFTLSFFEWTTLVALVLIKRHHDALDLVVLEVGLGGRLDTVNIVQSDFSIITSIDLDHQQVLGDTRDKIAFEKAGIIANNGLLVCAEPDPPGTIFDALEKNNASSYFIDHDFHVEKDNDRWNFKSRHGEYSGLTAPLFVNNLAAALMLWLKLPNSSLSVDQCRRAFSSLSLPGRYEIDPKSGIIYDVAHNVAAVSMLCSRLKSQKNTQGRLIAVFAMLKDKDVWSTLPILEETFDVIFCPHIRHPRAMNPLKVSQRYKSVCVGLSMLESLKEALDLKNEHDTMVVFGSFYTVAEAKACLQDDRL